MECNVLTCIDPVTNLVELIRIEQVECLPLTAIHKLLAVPISKTESIRPRQWRRVHWLEIPRALITVRYQGYSDYSQESSV